MIGPLGDRVGVRISSEKSVGPKQDDQNKYINDLRIKY
jgi:hypothetical protein